MPNTFNVNCPTCNKSVIWSTQSPFRPFCSKRCQMIDLGTWANEENAIPGETVDLTMDPTLDGVINKIIFTRD